MSKFEQRVKRFSEKIAMSKTPIPGFIMGLSGTDSIIAFLLTYEAMKIHGKQAHVRGIHYIEDKLKPTWFDRDILPWLKEQCPEAKIESIALISNNEEDRWHHMHSIKHGEYWVAACINNTEKRLGKYTIYAKSASIWPVATLWKTDIMQICQEKGVPQIAMDMSRLPDCICGRDELAAENIELIDEILQYKVDPTKYDPELLKKMMQWVYDIQKLYDFKERTPYHI